jgi:L-amino acid N-acyltransferase YncA
LRVLNIRLAAEADHNAIWNIFHEIVAAGDTYAFDPRMSRDEALAYWFGAETHTYVAENHRCVVGTSILRANQPGAGSHVANAAFMVAKDARGLGVGRQMTEHSLTEAAAARFSGNAIQFCCLNEYVGNPALAQLGFKIVGTLPGAFRHPRAGYIDGCDVPVTAVVASLCEAWFLMR